MSPRVVLIVALALSVLGSAIGNVYVKHQRRTLVVELHALGNERDAMQVEWGQLQLEQSTWATHDRIQALAASRLGLRMPTSDSLVLVVP